MAKNTANKRVAIIDADGLLYAEACASERHVKDGDEDMFLQVKTEEEAYAALLDRIDALVGEVLCTEAIICLSSNNNFRYGVDPTYKANRHGSRQPPLRSILKGLLMERKPFPVLVIDGLEADDVCGISAGNLEKAGVQAVVCSPDKDLRSVPCFLYSCRKDSVIEEITQEMADRFHLFQTLVGDPVDGYPGCPKVGAVKAKKLLDDCQGLSLANTWPKVLEAFTSRGLSEDFALTQARLARILRAEDWDATNKEPILWEPPVNANTANSEVMP